MGGCVTIGKRTMGRPRCRWVDIIRAFLVWELQATGR